MRYYRLIDKKYDIYYYNGLNSISLHELLSYYIFSLVESPNIIKPFMKKWTIKDLIEVLNEEEIIIEIKKTKFNGEQWLYNRGKWL